MSALKLPPPQREPGTGPNPSGERAPVEKSVPRTPKEEQAPVAAEAVASTPAATTEVAPASPEPKKKKAAPKKKAPTAVSTTPSEKPPTTPEIKIGDEVIWETNGAIQWAVPKKIKSIETYPTTGEKFALFEDVDTGIPLKELTLVTATTPPAPTPASNPEPDPLHVPPDPDAPKPPVPVRRAKLPSLPGRPAPAATPDAAPSAPVVPPEPAPATAPAVPPEVAPATTTPEPAAPPTPEPAPATPPATPEVTPPTPPLEPEPAPVTHTETSHAPPTPETKKGFFDSITSGFRSAADRFMARFRGEMTAKDEKDYKPTSMDVAASIAAGTISVVASYTGIKIVADLPEWLTQKYFTAQERKRIKDALKEKEVELGADYGSPAAFDAKKAKLEEAIQSSKFLTKEKKAKLIQDLKGVIDTRGYALVEAKNKRDQRIAKLLDEAIQVRIKNTQILKETLNSALMITGLAALRGAGYGAVALWERRARLMKDENFLTKKQARGLDRNVTFFNDLVIGGMKDTWKQLKGGGAETKAGKALNFVQGATTVMRAAGFAELAISEIQQEGVTGMIEASLKAWEQKSAGQFVADNITAPWERLGSLFSKASHAVTGTPETPPVSGTDTGDTGADTSDAGTDSGAADGSSAPEAGGSAEPATSSVEYPESAIATGTVHKGDGIIEILQRQGLSAKAALAAAREAGIVRAGGDTRLATESIGRIAVVVHETDGHAIIWFHDAQTGNMLSLDEARAQGFTYEHGAGAPEVSEPPVAHQIETPSEVPHSLAGSKLTLNTIEGGYNVDIEPRGLTHELDGMANVSAIEMAATGDIAQEQEMVKELSQRMASTQTVLERLDARHLGDSAEAQVLRQSLQQDLAQAQSMNVFDRVDLQKIQTEANQFHADALQSVLQTDRINDIRIPGLGKIEFTYDASGKPQFDLNQLITNAKPILHMRAANMLVDGWQNSVAHAYILQQEMQIAGPVYLMNEALKELKAGGHGESAEAKFLTEQLDGYLRANADVLDGNNAIVKEAAEKAGVYTEIFQS